MEQLILMFEGHPEETCPCGTPGTVSVVISRGGDEAVTTHLCTPCLYGNQHAVFLEEPKLQRLLKGAPTKRMKRTSKRQEQRVAEGIGARTSLASGAMDSDKSDSRLAGRLRVENKFTYAKQFTLKRQDLNKVRSECEGHEVPALQVDFKDRATNRTQDAWVVVPHKVWEKMINDAAENS